MVASPVPLSGVTFEVRVTESAAQVTLRVCPALHHPAVESAAQVTLRVRPALRHPAVALSTADRVWVVFGGEEKVSSPSLFPAQSPQAPTEAVLMWAHPTFL